MATFAFTILGNPTADPEGCAITLSAFEECLVLDLPSPALNQLRQRMLFSLTSDRSMTRAVRVLLQMAMETEVKATLVKLIRVAPDVMDTRVCFRRRYLDIDTDMQTYRFLFEAALVELEDAVPSTYVRLTRRFLDSPYARYRMSALAGALCMATAMLIPGAAAVELA